MRLGVDWTQLLAISCSSSVNDKVTITKECRDRRSDGMPSARPCSAPTAMAQRNVSSELQPCRLSSAVV